MPTNRRKRARNIAKTPLLDFVRILLTDGPEVTHRAMMDREPGTGQAEAFRMRKTREGAQPAWLLHRDEILRIWKAEKRTGKPWAAQQYEEE